MWSLKVTLAIDFSFFPLVPFYVFDGFYSKCNEELDSEFSSMGGFGRKY